MTKAEITLNSVTKEVEKLQIRIEKKEAQIQKNLTKCEKLGVLDWTQEEWDSKRRILMKEAQEAGLMFMQFKDGFLTEKQNEALWDRFVSYPSDMEDLQHRMKCATKRLSKAELAFYGVQEELAEQEAVNQKEQSWLKAIKMLTPEEMEKNRQEAERKYQEWLKEFKAECLKDGVIIDEAYNNYISGTTKSGKHFAMYINNGWTDRSWHCYTLYIDGRTIFTSGLFSTGYQVIKR